jgi:CubicO group peptidase (beta-lactamase class C family)
LKRLHENLKLYPVFSVIYSKTKTMPLRSKHGLLFCLCLLALMPTFAQPILVEGKPESVGMSGERLDRIDRLLQEYIDQGKLAGVAMLVARNGKIVRHRAYGYHNLETKTRLQREAIFRIRSLTKSVVSIAALTLFEEGKFLLDDPISKYIPEFKHMQVLDQFNAKDTSYTTIASKREITIRDIFTHTSGFTSYNDPIRAIYAKHNIISSSRTIGEAMRKAAKLPLLHQPGEQWSYGFSTDLLGYLCEVISRQALDKFLQNRLFTPLGMTNTYFYIPETKVHRLPAIYTEDANGKLERAPQAIEDQAKDPKGTYFAADGGLNSTLIDYAIFLQMLLNGGEYNGKRILSPATVRLALSNHIGELNHGFSSWGIGDKFGLGFSLTSTNSAPLFPMSEGSFSWAGSLGSIGWADPKEGIVGLISIQKSQNTTAGDFWRKYIVLVYQAIIELNHAEHVK